MSGDTILNEKDRVNFGHIYGRNIKPGEKAPQFETEFAFIVSNRNNSDYIDYTFCEDLYIYVTLNKY